MPANTTNPYQQMLYEGNFIHMFKKGRWEYVHRTNITGIVAIVALTDNNELVLTEQFRIPVNSGVIELPAGLAGDLVDQKDEPLAEAAKRELLEETGFQAQKIDFLTQGPPSPGLCDEIVTFFLATQLKKVHDGGGDDTEDITTHTPLLDQIDNWLLDIQKNKNLLLDPKTYAGIYFAKQFIKNNR